MVMQTVKTNLWFNDKAEEAARFYVSIFKNSKIIEIVLYNEAAAKMSGKPKGSVMTVAFELDGQQYIALNGGPVFALTPAVSLVVSCQTQEEIDKYWAKLLEGGGEEVQCGWLTDRFGLSWQVVPEVLSTMLLDKNAEKAERVMTALLQMKKIDIQLLQNEYMKV